MQNLNDPCSGLERILFFHAHQLNFLIHHRIPRTIRNFLRPWSPYSIFDFPQSSTPSFNCLFVEYIFNNNNSSGRKQSTSPSTVISIFRAMIYFHSMWSYDYGFTKNKVNFCRRRRCLSASLWSLQLAPQKRNMAACKPIEKVECKFFFRSRSKGLKFASR